MSLQTNRAVVVLFTCLQSAFAVMTVLATVNSVSRAPPL